MSHSEEPSIWEWMIQIDPVEIKDVNAMWPVFAGTVLVLAVQFYRFGLPLIYRLLSSCSAPGEGAFGMCATQVYSVTNKLLFLPLLLFYLFQLVFKVPYYIFCHYPHKWFCKNRNDPESGDVVTRPPESGKLHVAEAFCVLIHGFVFWGLKSGGNQNAGFFTTGILGYCVAYACARSYFDIDFVSQKLGLSEVDQKVEEKISFKIITKAKDVQLTGWNGALAAGKHLAVHYYTKGGFGVRVMAVSELFKGKTMENAHPKETKKLRHDLQLQSKQSSLRSITNPYKSSIKATMSCQLPTHPEEDVPMTTITGSRTETSATISEQTTVEDDQAGRRAASPSKPHMELTVLPAQTTSAAEDDQEISKPATFKPLMSAPSTGHRRAQSAQTALKTGALKTGHWNTRSTPLEENEDLKDECRMLSGSLDARVLVVQHVPSRFKSFEDMEESFSTGQLERKDYVYDFTNVEKAEEKWKRLQELKTKKNDELIFEVKPEMKLRSYSVALATLLALYGFVVNHKRVSSRREELKQKLKEEKEDDESCCFMAALSNLKRSMGYNLITRNEWVFVLFGMYGAIPSALIHYATFVGFLDLKCVAQDEQFGQGGPAGSGASVFCEHGFSGFLTDGETQACCDVISSRLSWTGWFSSMAAALFTAWTVTATIVFYLWRIHFILEECVTHTLWWDFFEQLVDEESEDRPETGRSSKMTSLITRRKTLSKSLSNAVNVN